MSKRLCKLNRHDISEQLGAIQRIVSAPKYLCRSCARASQDKSMLCKPMALSVAQSDVDSIEKSVIEPISSPTVIANHQSQVMADAEKGVWNQSQLKQAKKQAKKQKKFFKKLSKTVSKQEKLLRKQRKLEAQFEQINLSLSQMGSQSSHSTGRESVH